MSLYAERVKKIQSLMKKNSLDLFIIPSFDIHLSEYPARCFLEREFISGFKGSAGTLLIFAKEAFLVSDGRYELQMKKELEGSFIQPVVSSDFTQVLREKIKNSMLVGVDYKKLSVSLAKLLKGILKKKKARLKDVNLVTELWLDKPSLPSEKIFEQRASFVGESREEKLKKIRGILKEKKANAHFISSLDDIAYITNLRGLDVNYNPVFLSFLYIDENEAFLFVDSKKLDIKTRQRLQRDKIFIKEYEECFSFIASKKGLKVLIDPNKSTFFIARLFKKAKNKLIQDANPSTRLKACKNSKELSNLKNAMLNDGVALCKFFIWFEKELKKKSVLSELDIDEKLKEFRAKNELYLCDSFATIAGFNENAALPHYRAKKDSFSYIKADGLLLIDSGAQYQNGTTDITRVLALGKISKEHKKDYTTVLKSLIAMSEASFPKDVNLALIDSIARAKMWDEGFEYKHGTGHGVGYFLNVHEAPIVLSYYTKINEDNKAKIGVLNSIEPGIYREGKWGVRLENLVYIDEKLSLKDSEFGEFYHFKTLTLCPFEKKLIDKSLLDEKELKWLNAYHNLVFKKIAPYLNIRERKWLEAKTSAL